MPTELVCEACKENVLEEQSVKCGCGAIFCGATTHIEHQDLRTGQWVRQSFRCVDLHHCVRRLSSAINWMEIVIAKRQGPPGPWQEQD